MFLTIIRFVVSIKSTIIPYFSFSLNGTPEFLAFSSDALTIVET